MRKILSEKENPGLRKPAQKIPVADIKSAHIQGLIAEMKALLSVEKYGVALAAPQVGEPMRLFIVSGRALARGKRNAPDAENYSDAEAEEETSEPAPPDLVYINPELLKISRKKSEKHEGCLSVRGKWGVVPRAEKATVRAYDENGVRFTRGASGFLAHIFQHELDHLEGILYTDKATAVYEEKEEQPAAQKQKIKA
ncbi:MAG TPA: peptide deformylase [Candidatus Paceibacterota bacterium]